MSSIRDFSELFSCFYSHSFWITQHTLFQQYQRFTIPILNIIAIIYASRDFSFRKKVVFFKVLNVDVIGWCHHFYSQI